MEKIEIEKILEKARKIKKIKFHIWLLFVILINIVIWLNTMISLVYPFYQTIVTELYFIGILSLLCTVKYKKRIENEMEK